MHGIKCQGKTNYADNTRNNRPRTVEFKHQTVESQEQQHVCNIGIADYIEKFFKTSHFEALNVCVAGINCHCSSGCYNLLPVYKI